jgi:uncharacterized protein
MNDYHFRRPEKMITDRAAMLQIIGGQQIMTLALARDNQPYLVTLDYAYDTARNCFYFHCADHGRKIDYLAANPAVWGQILEDRGYLNGRCDHAYRTVHFAGQVEWLQDPAEKRHALELMIEHFESDPEPVKRKLLGENRVAAVAIGCIRVQEMTGKQNNG